MTFGFYFEDHPALGRNKLGFFELYCFVCRVAAESPL